MPWTANYLPYGAYVSFSGYTTGEDIIRAKADVYSRAQATPLQFVVLDYEAVENFDVDREDVERTSTQDLAAASDGLRHLAFATVAPSPITYGVARMWQAYIEPTGWQTAVVTSKAQAFTWLAEQGVTADFQMFNG